MIPQPASTSQTSADHPPTTTPDSGDASGLDTTVDGPQEITESEAGMGDVWLTAGDDEDNIGALFDWDEMEDDLMGAGFSEEEELVDEESESDNEL
ncbi:hypothetical protein FRC06_004489 [Ceratobasidium sp. 370]|nr:hypothetical protein FRC06_004489 [Ceratobasidium sp. 370]